MANTPEQFSLWLDRQLERRRWKQADLVRASGVKPNGRPVIDAPRVGSWLKGERPGPDLIVPLATALSVRPTDVMRAAGYPVDEPKLTLIPDAGEDLEPDVSQLAALIADVMHEDGLSRQQLERRADLEPGFLTPFLDEPLKGYPAPETINLLARALRCRVRDIEYAVSLDVDDDGEAHIETFRRLDPDDRRTVQEFAAFLDSRGGRKRRHA